jgi:hypothetical protein
MTDPTPQPSTPSPPERCGYHDGIDASAECSCWRASTPSPEAGQPSCPKCGVILTDTGYYEDGQRCHNPAPASGEPEPIYDSDGIPVPDSTWDALRASGEPSTERGPDEETWMHLLDMRDAAEEQARRANEAVEAFKVYRAVAEAHAPPALDYATLVERMAEALHDDCRLEWQAIEAVDPSRQVTMHEADAHLGKAHDLVRRLAITGESDD